MGGCESSAVLDLVRYDWVARARTGSSDVDWLRKEIISRTEKIISEVEDS
eukprot:SAG11_NODE_30001_length_305_cov_0.747573_1_plen_49_part_10